MSNHAPTVPHNLLHPALPHPQRSIIRGVLANLPDVLFGYHTLASPLPATCTETSRPTTNQTRCTQTNPLSLPGRAGRRPRTARRCCLAWTWQGCWRMHTHLQRRGSSTQLCSWSWPGALCLLHPAAFNGDTFLQLAWHGMARHSNLTHPHTPLQPPVDRSALGRRGSGDYNPWAAALPYLYKTYRLVPCAVEWRDWVGGRLLASFLQQVGGWGVALEWFKVEGDVGEGGFGLRAGRASRRKVSCSDVHLCFCRRLKGQGVHAMKGHTCKHS